MQNSATDLLSPVLAAQLFDPPSADSEYNPVSFRVFFLLYPHNSLDIKCFSSILQCKHHMILTIPFRV